MSIEAFIPTLIGVAIVAAILGFGYFQAKRAEQNLALLAGKLGFTWQTTGKFFKKHKLVGERRGKPIEIYNYTTGTSKSKQTWSAVAVTVRTAGGLTFSLEKRIPVLEVFTRLFRKNAVKVGDEAFDNAWILSTNQAEFMRAALLPDIRAKLIAHAGTNAAGPRFKLEVSRVVYSECGDFSRQKVCDHIEKMADLVLDLADIVEVGAEMKNPPA